jgi:hypothetical protein
VTSSEPTDETRAGGSTWRCLREEAGLSEAEMDHRLHTEAGAIAALEAGVILDLLSAERLADVYGYDVVPPGQAERHVTVDSGRRVGLVRRGGEDRPPTTRPAA